MGLLKNEHGVYVVRKKVPAHLQEAVATVRGASTKAKQVFLQRSLRTKDLQRAKVLAKPVLIEFDGVLARAEQSVADTPIRETLSAAEIERMAEYHYAQLLATHDVGVREAPDEERAHRKLAQELGDHSEWTEGVPEFGMTGGQMLDAVETLGRVLPAAESALARGDVAHVKHHVENLEAVFRTRINPKSAAYRDLGLAVLCSNVRGLRAIQMRIQGEPIETPRVAAPHTEAALTGETLRAAFEGWKKARNPAAGTLSEYGRAIDLFVELHGDLPVVQIRKSHARTLRETLQDLPRHRSGNLAKATFVEQAAWGKAHPTAQKISAGTVNKLLGGVQAVALWARDNGVIPDDTPWADPFANMRLEEDDSERESFTVPELSMIFSSQVFAAGERPKAGQGEAAFWLPLLALFNGARRSELAGLTAANVTLYEGTGVPVFTFMAERQRAKSLKTKTSARTVPVHPELIRLGWLEYVEEIRRAHGATAWLFPELSPENGPAPLKAWTKWFNRNLRTLGVTDTNKVFHSFRHSFKDALRAADVPEDLNDALTGHSTGTVGRAYGAKAGPKAIVRRFGLETLRKAVSRVRYADLDLKKVKPHRRPDVRKRKRT